MIAPANKDDNKPEILDDFAIMELSEFDFWFFSDAEIDGDAEQLNMYALAADAWNAGVRAAVQVILNGDEWSDLLVPIKGDGHDTESE